MYTCISPCRTPVSGFPAGVPKAPAEVVAPWTPNKQEAALER